MTHVSDATLYLIEGFCIWKQNNFDAEDDSWETSCDTRFLLIEGTPKENLYNFCPKCGKCIKEG